jgi:methylenetetrahydrofolate reductase (NADH)
VESARVPTDLTDLRPRIVDFVRHASTEITPHDEKMVGDIARSLPAGTTVYVAHTPKATFEDVIRVAIKVRAAGLRASPHLVARRIPSENALIDALAQLRSAGVDQALLVAGDCESAFGPFKHTLDLLDSGILNEAGLARIGVAGHPEGIKAVAPELLIQALQLKQRFGESSGLRIHIVTQFGFNPRAIGEWASMLVRQGIRVPVHVGLAGPTSLTRLLKFAMAYGVGASLNAASKNIKGVTNVARMAMTPEEMIPALVQLTDTTAASTIEQPHFFTFGGALATADWLRSVTAGRFDVHSDGKLELHE